MTTTNNDSSSNSNSGKPYDSDEEVHRKVLENVKFFGGGKVGADKCIDWARANCTEKTARVIEAILGRRCTMCGRSSIEEGHSQRWIYEATGVELIAKLCSVCVEIYNRQLEQDAVQRITTPNRVVCYICHQFFEQSLEAGVGGHSIRVYNAKAGTVQKELPGPLCDACYIRERERLRARGVTNVK